MDIQIGLKVKQLRIARGMTQAKLADASGLTRGYISMLELRKSTMPSYEALSKIARALGVDIKEFKTDPEIVRLESPEEVLRKYQLMAPVSIPVYDHFYVHAGDAALAPIEYIYRARESFAPSLIILDLRSVQYCRGLIESVIASIISTTEKNHSPSCNTLRISLFLNRDIWISPSGIGSN